MTFTYKIPCFDLEQTARSGQVFRMIPAPDSANTWVAISQGHVSFIRQENNTFFLECDPDLEVFWKNYFDMDTDYEQMIASVAPNDAYLKAAAQAGKGIRILRQDTWEMIITFVISQQKTIPAIRALVEALCSRYGTKLLFTDDTCDTENDTNCHQLYAFPTPEQLCQASFEDLLALKLGYRAKYIYRLCHDATDGHLDLAYLSTLDYEAAMDYLTGFYGIGKKVANCVCLFGLHHINAFPVDTWIEKILNEHYYNAAKYKDLPKKKLYDQMITDSFGCYKGYAGVMQQYIFNYERNVIHGK